MNPLPLVLDPNRAVVLRRVSSTEQADGYGLDSQATDCARFAKANGLEVVADYFEDVRSTIPLDERASGRDALDAMMRWGAGTLLLARRDRLARDTYIAGHAKRVVALMGARILYAEGGNGDDDSSLFMDDIQHAVAAQERRAIVARLRKGRDEKARKHPHARAQGGKVPYGYVRTATALRVDPERAAEVRRCFELVRDGQSVRKAAATMTAETGRVWSFTTVAGIVRDEIYKRELPGRIVDPRVWNAAAAARSRRRRQRA
jgi:DNA invertase Pin-like site-specific DNA recombinase